MSENSKENQRFLRWARAGWLGIFLSTIVLFLGIMAAGGGHGTTTPCFFGLVLSFVTWLVMLISVIVGFRGIKKGIWMPALFLQSVAFLALTCLGVWGAQG